MAATQFSPLFGDTYASIDPRGPLPYNFRRFARRSGFRKNSGLFAALIGAVSGGTATKTHKQIAEDARAAQGDAGPGGGQRTIETVTDISRATTASDVTNLKSMTSNVKNNPSPYVVDLSGNGGPAFTPNI